VQSAVNSGLEQFRREAELQSEYVARRDEGTRSFYALLAGTRIVEPPVMHAPGARDEVARSAERETEQISAKA